MKNRILVPLIALGMFASTSTSISAAESMNTVEVKSKDTLWSLSQIYEVPIEDLYEMNPNVNPYQLSIGSELNIGDYATDAHHTVTPGNSFYNIANLYEGVTLEDLYEWNPDTDPYTLQPGDHVQIKPDTDKFANHLSKEQAADQVRNTFEIDDDVRVEYDNIVDGDYLMHAYKTVNDHTATQGWYTVDPITGTIENYTE